MPARTPGPACYGRGGTAPTVTDAKLITGALNPAYFAAGRFDLDIARARAAVSTVADRLGGTTEAAANAIVRLAEANMIDALKLVSIVRGHDPRDFAMVVAGGGGPMHGAALGRELGVREIVVPRHPGLFSAWGMLAMRPRQDFVRTAPRLASRITTDEIRSLRDALRAEAERYFAEAGLGDARLTHALHIDLRYEGQEHAVAVGAIDADRATVAEIVGAFHAAHARTYSYRLDDTPVEFRHLPPDLRGPDPGPCVPPHRGRRTRAGAGIQGQAPGRFRRRRPSRSDGLRARPAAARLLRTRPARDRGAPHPPPWSSPARPSASTPTGSCASRKPISVGRSIVRPVWDRRAQPFGGIRWDKWDSLG